MRLTRWTKWAAIAGVTVMLASGCSALKSKESMEIDPPPALPGAAGKKDGAVATGAGVQQSLKVTLYMKDRNNYVAPVTVQVPKTEAVARTTLEYMIDGGPGQAVVPAGFTGLLPKGTIVKGIDINPDKKVATVDFSKEFTSYNPADERKIVEAVTYALTGFPNVSEVQLWVEGKQLKEMPQGKLPLGGTLSRAMGINIERAEGADFGQTTPVTLYFLGQTDERQTYYVPVTRMVKRTDDKAKATIEQLIAGPMQNKLFSVMGSTVELPKIESANGVITVNFSDTLLGPDHKAPGEALQAVVLSLTEIAGDAKVQIKVNNDVKVSSTDNQSYSKPVSRPTNVNAIKL
ncbi:GerMN domain-containing protein [Paenibacillus hodogayensis]|uniref:GerMN domain-containing protein n=1 Tax=Paenibacillus hodogayensis TaxID=279208 RepID=A0ABV5VW16_9BACL